MFTNRFLARAAVAVLLAALCTPAIAQGKQSNQLSPLVESNLRARKIVDSALEAMGGREALRKIESISLKFDGEVVQRHQSRRPEPPYERTRSWGEIAADLKNNKYMQEFHGSYVGGFNFASRAIAVGKEAKAFDLVNKRARIVPDGDQQLQDAIMQRLPFAALLAASDRETDLRYVGQASFEGRTHDLVSFSGPRHDLWTLYIDSASDLVSKYEWVTHDPYTGDTVREAVFEDYRRQGSVMIPARRRTYVAGELVTEAKYFDIKVNQPLADATFAAPAGYPEAAVARPGDPVAKFASNVYQFRTASGFNVLMVGFKDHVLVVEAPGNARISKQITEKAAEIFPDKLITQVAVTHFHDDHAGGVRTFMRDGKELITTAGNIQFFKNIAGNTSPKGSPEPKLVAVKGKLRLSDGETTVELYDIGKGPHTDEMLIAYIPSLKLIFQGDLLNRPPDGTPQAGNDTTVHFAKRLREMGLDVQTVAGVHGPHGTMQDLQAAVRLHEERAQQKASTQ